MIPASHLFDQSLIAAPLEGDQPVTDARSFFSCIDWSMVERGPAARSRSRLASIAHPSDLVQLWWWVCVAWASIVGCFAGSSQEINIFTAEQRDQVRQRVLALAQSDPRVIAGALTGSMAFGDGDEWSDIDVAFGIAEGIAPEAVLDDWTHLFEQQWGVLDHFDLRYGSSVYRVFLLPSGLEIDVAVTPAEDFGARGPNFRALFGPTQQVPATPQPSASSLIGLSSLYVLHAHASIERHKLWQAEYWISGIREQVLELACLRLGENARERRGVDGLTPAVTGPLAETLVRSLDEPELRRALAAATRYLMGELETWDASLCARLSTLLHEFGALQTQARNALPFATRMRKRKRSFPGC